MTEEEFQELLKEVWEERTPIERGDIPARPSDIPYESFEAFEAAVRGSELYRALTATNAAVAKTLLGEGMREGFDVVDERRSNAFRQAQADLTAKEGSVLTETFFEDQEPEPELTASQREARGAEVLEEAGISLWDAERMTSEALVEAGAGEDDLEDIFAFVEAATAKDQLDPRTKQLYGLTSETTSDFISAVQDEARAAGLGDLTTMQVVDLLNFGTDPEINMLASGLAVGNTYDRKFIKLPNGNDFFVEGDDYQEVLNVIGSSNADLLNISIAAAVEHGIADDDGWKNFMLVALENQKQTSQGGLAAITESDLPLSRLTAGAVGEGPDTRSLKQARLTAEAKEYSQFLRKYNGVHALAMLAAGGRKDLADEAFQSGGLSAQGRQEARDFLAGLGSDQDLQAMNIDPSDKYWTQLTQGPSGGVGAEAGLSLLPNSEDSREAYRTLYRSFFMEDPDDAVLDGFAENVKSQYLEFDAASRQGTNLFRDEPARERELREALRSPEAMAMQQIRDNPQYDALYGNRGSLTEAQYRTQFQNRIAGLGADVGMGTGAIEAGMRTGRGSTTTGRLLFSEEGKQAQGLQGRLAQAANVIARNT